MHISKLILPSLVLPCSLVACLDQAAQDDEPTGSAEQALGCAVGDVPNMTFDFSEGSPNRSFTRSAASSSNPSCRPTTIVDFYPATYAAYWVIGSTTWSDINDLVSCLNAELDMKVEKWDGGNWVIIASGPGPKPTFTFTHFPVGVCSTTLDVPNSPIVDFGGEYTLGAFRIRVQAHHTNANGVESFSDVTVRIENSDGSYEP